MNKHLISIIVPIYNVASYISDLFVSIDNQTYANYEVLLINDGSTDESETICKNYCKQNKKCKYYYKENSGVSNTRNYGIERARGEYICFVDSDDLLDKNYLNDFIDALEETDSDMIVCNVENFKDTVSIYSNEKYEIEKAYGYKNKFEMIFDKYCGYTPNKIFNTKILKDNKIKFNEKIYMMEDMLFVYEYVKNIETISCINKPNYKYRYNQDSASKKLNNIKWFSLFETLDIIIKEKENYSEKLYNQIIYNYMHYLYQAKFRLNYINQSKEYKIIKKNINKRIMMSKGLIRELDLKQKIKILIYKNFNFIAFKIKQYKDSK